MPYNWNVQYQKRIFISNVALTELIMKRYWPTYSYISPRYKAHKAFTFSFHSFLFAARALRVAHDGHLTVCFSSLYVLTGKPNLNKRYET